MVICLSVIYVLFPCPFPLPPTLALSHLRFSPSLPTRRYHRVCVEGGDVGLCVYGPQYLALLASYICIGCRRQSFPPFLFLPHDNALTHFSISFTLICMRKLVLQCLRFLPAIPSFYPLFFYHCFRSEQIYSAVSILLSPSSPPPLMHLTNVWNLCDHPHSPPFTIRPLPLPFFCPLS